MNFPHRCPQCGVLVRDLTEAEMAENSCPGFPEGCTLSVEIDEHIEVPNENA